VTLGNSKHGSDEALGIAHTLLHKPTISSQYRPLTCIYLKQRTGAYFVKIDESCVGSSNNGRTQETQEENMIYSTEVSEKSKKTYGHFSDYGSIYLVDMVLIRTYNVLISFRSSL